MEKIDNYRQILQEVLTAYATPRTSPSQPTDVETQVLFDTQNDHYQVLRVGWRNRTQVFLVIFHFDIKNEKIWLQQNVTDYDIIGDLEERGIPKSDIVLAFHSPQMRPFTGYAVA
jgi:XisI protein